MTVPDLEILRSVPRGGYKAVLFDFDGTLSLLREGWPAIMVAMMVEELRRHGAIDPEAELSAYVEDFVMALNGRPTIYQMARLVEEIEARGGRPEPATTYLQWYDERLLRMVGERTGSIAAGRSSAERWAVPGSHAILGNLRDRGIKVYLASGTDRAYVLPEADLLGVSKFFGGDIHAPAGSDPAFSKRAVIETILAENGLAGEQLLSFGDGVVETQEVRRVGGTAVAVASEEPPGPLSVWKRDRLAAAGADLVIPDYRHQDRLLGWLLPGE